MGRYNENKMSGEIEELKSLDWDLKNVNTAKYSANIHPYHARFIPQIPERLIEHYTEEGDKVLDPFNGSGTATMVAGALQRYGIGVDLNPLACLIARVKCYDYNIANLKEHINKFLSNAEKNIREVDSQPRINNYLEKNNAEPKLKIPDFPDKNRWYQENVLKQLGVLYYMIENIESKKLEDFYRVCFSGITKSVCRSDEDWTYIGDNMYPDSETNSLTPDDTVYDVYQKFKQKTDHVLSGVEEYVKTNPLAGEIYNKDSRKLDFLNDSSVDFAITSPPYANAVDYARYHRLSFYWFGWDINETKEEEIGARAKRGRKTAVEDYFEESKDVYREVFRTLKSDSVFCIIAGDTQHNKNRVEIVKNIKNMCEEIGYNYQGEIVREVSSQSMSQKEITNESLVLLSKP